MSIRIALIVIMFGPVLLAGIVDSLDNWLKKRI